MSQDTTAQIEFDKAYIAPAEMKERFGVSSTMLRYMRENGQMPNFIKVGYMYVWPREVAEPILARWVEQKEAKNRFYK
ncbi:hypothetical protein Vid5_gp62 [Pantoea phage vB_PagS_Vid5]|uniref:Uncharacterized protein n=1 Tax=Pantoea phage vB_PagS_Vid5 TaxID=2099652 RepID=A0A2P1CKN4_9CAUD|nr:hypothetical protein FDJ45_gp093 [Pantoea phage vB_PagS_Vid5]AVJ51817.1 hypothetical protein Vid5_gp62 [Pantoea phage vB_PagS_Vid5]